MVAPFVAISAVIILSFMGVTASIYGCIRGEKAIPTPDAVALAEDEKKNLYPFAVYVVESLRCVSDRHSMSMFLCFMICVSWCILVGWRIPPPEPISEALLTFICPSVSVSAYFSVKGALFLLVCSVV